MKRLTYISRFTNDLSAQEIAEIGRVSAKNNSARGISGVLICLNGIFYQIIEGEAAEIDRVYETILADPRHSDVVCLKNEADAAERIFGEWSMETFNLDEKDDLVLQPVTTLLETLTSSHQILERYTQPTVLDLIYDGVDPLTVPSTKVEKVILVSDIVSFTQFADALEAEEVVRLVNTFSRIVSDAVLEYGGQINKFMGDGALAYFDGLAADDALKAGLSILKRLQQARDSAGDSDPLSVLYCGVGIARGVVIEGNLGSESKRDFTIIGDAVNVASRLEALTRRVPRWIIFSQSVTDALDDSWDVVGSKDYVLKGKREGVRFYSVNRPEALKEKKNAEIIRSIGERIGSLSDRRTSV
ncbi:MAG: BLUF domain-containing protein [Spirochaetales bacterium]